jgi:hypothetical protein
MLSAYLESERKSTKIRNRRVEPEGQIDKSILLLGELTPSIQNRAGDVGQQGIGGVALCMHRSRSYIKNLYLKMLSQRARRFTRDEIEYNFTSIFLDES